MGTMNRMGRRSAASRFLASALALAVAAGLSATPAIAADASRATPERTAAAATKTPATKAAKKAVADTPASAPLTSVTEINATLGKSVLVNLERPVARLSVGSPAVADVILISAKQLYVLGKTVGSTNLMLWDRQGQAAAVIDLNVSRELGALNSEIQRLVPEASVRVRSMGENIVLEGHAPDAVTASKASDLADTFVGKKVVNMLIVDGIQQVMLEVKIAEINRTLIDSLGAKFGLSHPSSGGGIGWTLVGDLLSSAGSASLPAIAPALQGGTTPFSNPLVSSNVSAGSGLSLSKPGATNRLLNIDMLKQDGLLKILAEPNIVALSGHEGGFLAGGQIFIPVPQANGTITLESQNFGVGLKFTPTVLDGGRINLRVAPEVTDVVGFTNVATTGFGSAVLVPTLTTRRASTTVQLKDGQTLAIGGLLNDSTREQVNRLPILGEIPILGALFRSSQFQTDRTELVIMVTPRLVKPLASVQPLPTDGFKEPTRGEFFLGGRMEGKPDEPPVPAAPPKPTLAPAPQAPAEAGGHQLK